MILKRKTSGLLIIGNEILSGKTIDTNSNFISKELSNRGVDTKEISIIPDVEDIIVLKLKEFSKQFDYVFTSGGIGPTHDDITAASVAKAFKKKLVLNENAKALLEKHYEYNSLTSARLKMALLPKDSKLINNPVSVAPGFNLENVYVFPGVPDILKVMFLEFVDNLLDERILPQKTISTILAEGIIGTFVGKVQKEHIEVEIGSYPYFKNNSFGVSLVIKSEDTKKLELVSKKLFRYLEKHNGKPKYF